MFGDPPADPAVTSQAKTAADTASAKLDAAKTEYQAALAAATASATKAQADKAAADLANDQPGREAATKAAADAAVQQAKAKATLDTIANWQATLDRINATLARSTNPDGSINPNGAGSAVGQLLPWPFNLIAYIGIPLIVGGVQQARVSAKTKEANDANEAATAIVNSIDALRAHPDPSIGPVVRAAMAKPEAKVAMQAQLAGTAATDLIKSETIT